MVLSYGKGGPRIENIMTILTSHIPNHERVCRMGEDPSGGFLGIYLPSLKAQHPGRYRTAINNSPQKAASLFIQHRCEIRALISRLYPPTEDCP